MNKQDTREALLPSMIQVGDELIMGYNTIKILGIQKKSWGRIPMWGDWTSTQTPCDPRCTAHERTTTCRTSLSPDCDRCMSSSYGVRRVYRNGELIWEAK